VLAGLVLFPQTVNNYVSLRDESIEWTTHVETGAMVNIAVDMYENRRSDGDRGRGVVQV